MKPMTSTNTATVSAAYSALIAHSPAMAAADPALIEQFISAAQAAGLMPERETNLEWAVEFRAGGGKQVLMPDKRGALDALDFIREAANGSLQDPGKLVHRERTSYTNHIGEWVEVPVEEATA